MATILTTEGNEEMWDKMVMPGGVMSTSLSSGLGNTMWGDLVVGRNCLVIAWVVEGWR